VASCPFGEIFVNDASAIIGSPDNTRYNAKIQRAKGLLELAAAMYETSLSFQTTRAAEQVLQTESRVGHALRLALVAASREGSNSVNLSFAADSFAELKGVAEGKYARLGETLRWQAAPRLTAAWALQKKLPLRVIATFPPTTSWVSRFTSPPA
jgi:hypothetical protein